MLVLSIYINFIIQYLFVLPSSSITLFTMGAQAANRSGNTAQKNRREFCENDFKIIEAIQSNQMDTESVAIFIDDEFDLVYRKVEVFRFVANRKAFFVKNLIDTTTDADGLTGDTDKILNNTKNRSTLPNSQDKEINYATTTQQALTLSKTFSMAFILSSVDDMPNTFRMMIEQPSLVKIVLNYKECFHNKTMYENGVKNVSQQLWIRHRVLHIYYIPLCLIELNQSTMDINVAVDGDDYYEYEECLVDDIYVYDAFELYPKDISSSKGMLRRFSTLRRELKTNQIAVANDDDDDGSGDDDEAKSFNDFLRIDDGRQFNLHGMAINVSFFPTTMAYLKADTKLFMQTSTEPHLLDLLSTSPDIYFGVDVEILKEFARKINFTPHVINPSDKQYYGFRIPEALLILKIFTEQLWTCVGVSILAFSGIYFAFVGYLNDIQRFTGNQYRKLRGLLYFYILVQQFVLPFVHLFSNSRLLMIACVVVVAFGGYFYEILNFFEPQLQLLRAHSHCLVPNVFCFHNEIE